MTMLFTLAISWSNFEFAQAVACYWRFPLSLVWLLSVSTAQQIPRRFRHGERLIKRLKPSRPFTPSHRNGSLFFVTSMWGCIKNLLYTGPFGG